MTIPDHRLSNQVVDGIYVPPEGEIRYTFIDDKEGGPVALVDTSGGMNYQVWEMSYSDPDLILTPRDSGSPVTVLSVPGIRQASFCFDQNARPSVCYGTDSSFFLYWYDSDIAEFVTTEYPDVVGGMLSLDDKRYRQIGANDIIFWYTEEVSPNVYNLYTREQRDRFTIPYLMKVNGVAPEVPPYLWKAGMHQGLRGKVTLTYRVP